jgi:hypothetical protein
MLHEAQQHRQSSNLAHYAEPLLPLLKASDTLDVIVNADGSLWVNRLGRGFAREGVFAPTQQLPFGASIPSCRYISFRDPGRHRDRRPDD